MEIKHNVAGWFEIPVSDMERAIRFYETVFGLTLDRQQLENLDMAWFPWVETGMGSGGSLVFNPDFYSPTANGTLVYLTAFSGDLANELGRVEAAGGKVLMEKRMITEDIGYMGLFLDSEGNRVAMHSRG